MPTRTKKITLTVDGETGTICFNIPSIELRTKIMSKIVSIISNVNKSEIEKNDDNILIKIIDAVKELVLKELDWWLDNIDDWEDLTVENYKTHFLKYYEIWAFNFIAEILTRFVLPAQPRKQEGNSTANPTIPQSRPLKTSQPYALTML